MQGLIWTYTSLVDIKRPCTERHNIHHPGLAITLDCAYCDNLKVHDKCILLDPHAASFNVGVSIISQITLLSARELYYKNSDP